LGRIEGKSPGSGLCPSVSQVTSGGKVGKRNPHFSFLPRPRREKTGTCEGEAKGGAGSFSNSAYHGVAVEVHFGEGGNRGEKKEVSLPRNDEKRRGDTVRARYTGKRRKPCLPLLFYEGGENRGRAEAAVLSCLAVAFWKPPAREEKKKSACQGGGRDQALPVGGTLPRANHFPKREGKTLEGREGRKKEKKNCRRFRLGDAHKRGVGNLCLTYRSRWGERKKGKKASRSPGRRGGTFPIWQGLRGRKGRLSSTRKKRRKKERSRMKKR